MPSIHSIAQAQHRKQEKIEYIENKFQEILKKRLCKSRYL